MKKNLLTALLATLMCLGVQAQTPNPNNDGTSTPDGTETGIDVSQETLNQNLAILRSQIQSLGAISASVAGMLERLDIIEMYQNPANNHEYVDLGVVVNGKPVYWATTNIGADSPTDYGLFFAWGEIVGYDSYPRAEDNADGSYSWSYTMLDGRKFDWTNYSSKFTDGDWDKMKKYCLNEVYGAVDNKTVLDLEDDAAHVNWNGAWRIPTIAELDALCSQCNWSWITMTNSKGENVQGYQVSNKQDSSKYIFLPAAGNRHDDQLFFEGSEGYYWANSITNTMNASYLLFSEHEYIRLDYFRFEGCSVRPVFNP